MKGKMTKPGPAVTLFFDDSEEGQKAKNALEGHEDICRDYQCMLFHVNSLNLCPTEQLRAPLLFAPEGVFQGWKQIQAFLRIPSDMRYSALLEEPWQKVK